MSDTSTVDQGHKQLDRRASDQKRASGSQARFNPLHPSLELPPEQLIRLLGLEDKQSRRKHRTSKPAEPENNEAQTPLPVQAPVEEKPLPKLEVPTDHRMYKQRQHRRVDTTPFPPQRTNLLWKATGIGIVAGIAVSAYVFWWQPDSEQKLAGQALESTPAQAQPQATDPTRHPVPTPIQPSSHAAPKPIEAPTAAKAPTAAAMPAPVVTPNPARPEQQTPPVSAEPASSLADDSEWRAAIENQEQRLRSDAEQRLRERLLTGSGIPADSTVDMTTPADNEPAIVEPPVTNDLSSGPALEDPAPEPNTPAEVTPTPESVVTPPATNGAAPAESGFESDSYSAPGSYDAAVAPETAPETPQAAVPEVSDAAVLAPDVPAVSPEQTPEPSADVPDSGAGVPEATAEPLVATPDLPTASAETSVVPEQGSTQDNEQAGGVGEAPEADATGDTARDYAEPAVNSTDESTLEAGDEVQDQGEAL